MQQEEGYLSLMKNVLENGEHREGRNGGTRSIFGNRLEFDLRKGFPLLTTKRVFWRGVVEELLWFLRGSTDANELKTKNIHIWDGNTTREFLDNVGLHDVAEGHIGAGYGYQWRCFGGNYPSKENGVDQVRYVLKELSENPHGRRAVLNAWNPQQLHRMALPPCHMSYQFFVGNDGLQCMMMMRSCDIGAGLPFNIASTALFTHILAHVLNVPAHRVIIVMGDTHLYDVHLESATEQIERKPYDFPSFRITKEAPAADASLDEKLKWIETLCYDTDFEIQDYNCHPALKYVMVA